MIERTFPYLAIAAVLMACSSSGAPPSGTDEPAVTSEPEESCSSEPPTNAFCAPCDGGYKQIDGKPTCECCDDTIGEPDAGGETCGEPPTNAFCAPCDGGYKQIDGKPTCECCAP